MLKTIMTVIACAPLALGIAACGDSKEEKAEPQTKPAETDPAPEKEPAPKPESEETEDEREGVDVKGGLEIDSEEGAKGGLEIDMKGSTKDDN